MDLHETFCWVLHQGAIDRLGQHSAAQSPAVSVPGRPSQSEHLSCCHHKHTSSSQPLHSPVDDCPHEDRLRQTFTGLEIRCVAFSKMFKLWLLTFCDREEALRLTDERLKEPLVPLRPLLSMLTHFSCPPYSSPVSSSVFRHLFGPLSPLRSSVSSYVSSCPGVPLPLVSSLSCCVLASVGGPPPTPLPIPRPL